jgi:uncharacterized protein (TIGR03066 family)
MACGVLGSARAEDKKEKRDHAKLLIGKWAVTKAAQELPVGTVIDFGVQGGTMKVTAKRDGKVQSFNGVYKVEGDKIQFTLKLPDRDERKDPLTIKKISKEELVLEAKDGVAFEFKRAK